MSIFCTIGKSTIGTVLQQRAHRHLSVAFKTCESSYIQPNLATPAPQRRRFHRLSPKDAPVHTWFVSALITASQCRWHAPGRPRSCGKCQHPNPRFKTRLGYFSSFRRYQHAKNSAGDAEKKLATREELLALVDQYDRHSSTDDPPALKASALNQQLPKSNPVISDKERDASWPPQRYIWPSQGAERKVVEQLEAALKDTQTDLDPEKYYQLYRNINAPRVPYLSAASRHALLLRLGALERKDEQAMLRYLSVVDDMKASGIPLTTAEWNMALSFAGRYVTRTRATEVEGALRMWRDMEHIADIRSNAVTFNILFDAATKAGKFRLAEMIYQEMENRGHSFDRFHHVSVIHYHGLRADGEGVRKAYRALVDACEIVDVVVLNCMISSLIRAYEPQAAIHVYEGMKRLYESKSGITLPSRDYKKSRQFIKILMRMGLKAKRNPAKLEAFQELASITPNVKTYRILIEYVAISTGELHRTAQMLDEMRMFNVPLHGSIFLALFKAFAIHGPVRYSRWTETRLDSVWKAYLRAAEDPSHHVYIGKWVIYWALKAFKSCAGREKATQAWDEIKNKWTPETEELAFVIEILMKD